MLVNTEGNVKTSEPVTTSGYPELDMIASNFVKGWAFEPQESIYGKDEWITREITINSRGQAR
jgi:outer membrane biosynthesis protein TonB